MNTPEEVLQRQKEQAIAAKTVRVEKAQNGYIVKRIDGHFVYPSFKEASKYTEMFFESQANSTK